MPNGFCASVYDLCQAIGANAVLVYVQWNLGLVMREQGRLAASRDLLAQTLNEAAALDDPHVTAQLQGELGVTELCLGAYEAARTDMRRPRSPRWKNLV